MQKFEFVKKISPITRLICLVLLVISILISKSVYLILFITTFILLMCTLSNKNLKLYIKFIRNRLLVLIPYTFLFTIVFKQLNLFGISLILYKFLLVLVSIKVFELNNSFVDLHSAFYKALFPFKESIREKYSYYICLALYLLNYIFESREDIKNIQKFNGKRSYIFKNYFGAIVLSAIKKLINFENNLKVSCYKLNSAKTSSISKIVFITSVVFFIICMIKEVIL